jgi:hypothetical protein
MVMSIYLLPVQSNLKPLPAIKHGRHYSGSVYQSYAIKFEKEGRAG